MVLLGLPENAIAIRQILTFRPFVVEVPWGRKCVHLWGTQSPKTATTNDMEMVNVCERSKAGLLDKHG